MASIQQRVMETLDNTTVAWPVFRNLGDHFLVVLRRC